MELAWVGLNYGGIERTETEATVQTVADIHLAYMPYSHSVLTALFAALLVWFCVEKGAGFAALGRALALGIVSHLVLDLVTHDRDIALWPGVSKATLGFGLYGVAPPVAFGVELAYGIVCWRIHRGTKALLALIVLGNLMNVSLFFRAVPGPEIWLAGHPLRIVSLVFVQIVGTLWLVGVFGGREPPLPSAGALVT
jgi:hypothetical protein